MARVIELAPRSPFHDINGFVANIRAAHPGISDKGVDQSIKRALDGYNPRHSGRVVHLFGADIMAATVEDIPAWPYITAGEQQRILDHPMETGERVDDHDGKVSQLELANRLNRESVNRSVLISPRGLQQTYVWRLTTNWIQDVTNDDYNLILSEQGNRRLFRDPEIHGPYVDVRSYANPPVLSRMVTADQRDIDAFMRERTHRPSWSGVDTAT